MKDLVGFPNVAYFDTEWERDLFISNVENIPDVVIERLAIVTRDDVPMYPIHLVFTDDPAEPGVSIANTPF